MRRVRGMVFGEGRAPTSPPPTAMRGHESGGVPAQLSRGRGPAGGSSHPGWAACHGRPDSAGASIAGQPEVAAGLAAPAGEGFCPDCHEDAGLHNLRCPHFDLDGLAQRVAREVGNTLRTTALEAAIDETGVPWRHIPFYRSLDLPDYPPSAFRR